MRLKNKLSVLVPSQLPEHIVAERPIFTTFLKAYYEFLEQDQYPQEFLQNNLLYDDIDSTIDSFIEYFMKEYANNIPRSALVDKKLLVKHINSLYETKGSPRSYELLFRLLYDKEIDYFFPSKRILRASDGKWIRNVSVLLRILYGNPNDIVNKIVKISNETKEFQLQISRKKFAENLYGLNEEIYEYFIDDSKNIPIDVGDKITLGNFEAIVLQTSTQVEILRAGKGFEVGTILNLKSGGGYRSKVKVIKVDEQGGVLALQILSFGIGYDTDFYNYFSPGIREPIKSSYDLEGDELYLGDSTSGFVDEGMIYIEGYAEIGYFAQAYEGTVIRYFRTDTSFQPDEITSSGSSDDVILYVKQGSKARYPGYYENNDGFISDDIYIQDYHYYQPFSYVIRVDQQLKTYKQAILDNLHPAGTKLFGELLLTNEIDSIATIVEAPETYELEFHDNIISIEDYITNDIGKNEFEEIVIHEESIKIIDVLLSDENMIIDDSYKHFSTSFNSNIQFINDELGGFDSQLTIDEFDIVEVTDYYEKQIVKEKYDVTIAEDSISSNIEIQFADILDTTYFLDDFTEDNDDYVTRIESIIDDISFDHEKIFLDPTDSVIAEDFISSNIEIGINDYINNFDGIEIDSEIHINDLMIVQDEIGTQRELEIFDSFNVIDENQKDIVFDVLDILEHTYFLDEYLLNNIDYVENSTVIIDKENH
jgi:hypothetical protein